MNPNPEKLQAFMGEFLRDTVGAASIAQAALGDRLGIFRALSEHGPATAEALAVVTGLSERALREWLAGMATAGYLTFDPAEASFSLPIEHAMVLAHEGGPACLAPVPELIMSTFAVLDRYADALQNGGGVAQGDFPPTLLASQDRMGTRFEHALPGWMSQMPDVAEKLRRGARVLDVGCGGGRSAIALSKMFPEARITAVDNYAPAIERAKANAAEAGLADRIRFEVSSGKLPHESFDVVCAFDVVHDAADPLGLLTSMRNALEADGVLLILEPKGKRHIEQSMDPMGRFMYAQSFFYCMTVSLAAGGAGLGCCAGVETLRDLAERSGLSQFEAIPIEDPFDGLYRLAR
jgi:SAM-dependent methyltransferase